MLRRMSLAAPPRELTVAHLSRMAAAFDALDDSEGGSRWPAIRFVEYVRHELDAAGCRTEPVGRPGRKHRDREEPA